MEQITPNTIIIFSIAIILYSLSIVVILFTVIPLQIKEATVKNGLQTLRTKLLIKGVLALIVAITSILILLTVLIVDGSAAERFIFFLLLLNASVILGKSVIDNRIYHEQYTPEAKKVHKRVDVEEKKQKVIDDKNMI